MRLTRRELLKLGAAGLLLPRPGRAATATERKFIFVVAWGGWDPTFVFAPQFDSAHVDMPVNGEPWSISGLSLVDGADRPSVRAFFSAWADRCCVLDGLAVDSLGHEICGRLVLTGESVLGPADWGSLLAAHSQVERVLPLVVISGPSYPGDLAADVVRVGSNGQLAALVDGSAISTLADQVVAAPASALQELEDAHVLAAARRRLADGPQGRARLLAEQAVLAEERLVPLAAAGESLDLRASGSFADDLRLAVDCLDTGLSRCVQLAHGGALEMGWDTHVGIETQAQHYEELFAGLDGLLADLASRPGSGAATMADEVVVVVLSEMGRFPVLNSVGGKDHWVYTSALLIGPGLQGGRQVGGYDEVLAGRPVDLATGELSDSGTRVTAAHLGATLLALGGLDPGEWTDAEAIEGMLG